MTNNHPTNETARLEAFSDAVFAIAITLLTLELVQFLHDSPGHQLLGFLISHWESYFAFLIGFLTIFICWINHHLVFSSINKVNSKLLWANGFVLLVVTVTPFSTAVLAQFLGQEPNLALAIFGVNYFLVAVAAYNLSRYTYNSFLIKEEDRELYQRFKTLYGWSVIYTFTALFVCFISVWVCAAMYFIMFGIFAFPRESSSWIFKNRNLRADN